MRGAERARPFTGGYRSIVWIAISNCVIKTHAPLLTVALAFAPRSIPSGSLSPNLRASKRQSNLLQPSNSTMRQAVCIALRYNEDGTGKAREVRNHARGANKRKI